MDDIWHWVGFALGVGILGLGIQGFFSGLSLPPNTPEHRAHDKGDSWRIGS
jgi:hypothetical protein